MFVFGFAKNDRANLNDEEERLYKGLAKVVLELSEGRLNYLINKEALVEVEVDEKN